MKSIVKKGLAVMIAAMIVTSAGMVVTGCKRETPEEKKAAREVQLKKGTDLFSKQKFDQAITELEKATQEDPESAKAHYMLALSYEATNKLDKAKGEYEQAIKLDPKDPNYHYNLAILHKRKGTTDKAIAELEKSVELSKDFVGARVVLAELYSNTKKFDEAVAQYDYLLKLKPFGLDLSQTNVKLGLVYVAAGQKAKATAAFNKALELNPENADAKKNLGQLQ